MKAKLTKKNEARLLGVKREKFLASIREEPGFQERLATFRAYHKILDKIGS